MPELRRPKRCIPWKQLGLLLLIAAMGLPLRGLSQTMNYSSKKATLQQVFAEIKKQTNHVVVFNPEQVDVTQTVPVNARNQPLEAFMRQLLAKTPLNFTIVGTTIVIFRKADVPPEFNAPPPPVEVMGMVYDEKTVQPIPGVSVFASVSGKGTQTNEKGFFSLKNLKDAEMLTFSSIGYEKVTMAAGQPGVTMYVKMKVATSELDQAVVQGYGVTSKRLATGNITKVTGTEIASQPVMNPLQALQGRVPGLLVTQTSGYASSPVKLEIRGRNSLGKGFLSDPLYIIDGVPLTVLNLVSVTEGVSSGFVQGGFSAAGGQSPIFGLNAKDIESIEVLKDADATAIYGSRGANGVILITTKRGKTGKTALSVDVREGIVTVPRQWHLLDTREYLQMRREAFKNEGITPTIATAPDLMLWDTTRYTNWQKEILGTGTMTNVSASLSGGDNQNTFYVSANYGRQVELLSKSGASQKASVMSRLRHVSANQKFSIMVGTTIGYTKVDAIVNPGDAAYLPPNAPPIYDSKGNLNFAEWTAHSPNSQFPFENLGRKNISQSTQFDGSLELRYEIAKGLTFSTTGGYSFVNGTSDNFVPIAAQNPALNPTGMAIFGTTRNTNWIVEPQLAYTRFIGKGDLSVQAGTSYQSAATNGSTVFGFGFGDDALLGSISNAPFQQAAEMLSRYKYAAVFGRISYNWDNKYILNLNARRDGSSRFAPGRQYGNFGSVGMGWIMSEEPWMKAVLPQWVTFLKLRGSYGITGGDGSIGDYQYLSQWGTRTIGGLLGKYDGVQPYVPIHAMNQDYHWEANKKMEGSLSVGFLNDRINLEVSHYRNRTGDQVTGLPTPQYTGFGSVLANWAAVVQNSGWEGMLRANLVQRKDYSWSVSFNISRNRNILAAYPDLEFSPYYGTYKVGQSLSTRYYLHYIGIDPLTGKHAFEDRNKDGQVNVNLSVPDGTGADDRYVPIDDAPKYYGGIGSQFSWKGVRLDLLFDFKKQLGPDPFANVLPGAMSNLPREALANHWTKPGDNAKYAGFAPIGYTLFNASDGAFMDASYLRLRSLAVSYDIPEKLVKKARMESFRVYLQTENIFTITRYTGLDPDTKSLTALPSPRTITGGVMLNF